MFRFLSRRRSALRTGTFRSTKRRLGFEELESRKMLSTTYFVSPTGSDNNPGTSLQSPLQTLGAAGNLVQPGDTIEMLGGVYHPFGAWNKSGAPGQPITIQPYNSQPVVWDFSEQYTWTWTTAYGGCYTTTLPASSIVAEYKNVMVIGAGGLFANALGGSITAIDTTPFSGGSGYQAGEVLNVAGGATVTVEAVDANGAVTQLALDLGGQDGYSTGLRRTAWGGPPRRSPAAGAAAACASPR